MLHALSAPAALQPSVSTRSGRCAAALLRARRCPAPRSSRTACRAVAAAADAMPVMVNGVTGKMGFATAEAAAQRGLRLVPVAFSGAARGHGARVARGCAVLTPAADAACRAATRAGQRLECSGVQIELQPFDGAAFEALKQRYPVRARYAAQCSVAAVTAADAPTRAYLVNVGPCRGGLHAPVGRAHQRAGARVFGFACCMRYSLPFADG